MKVLISGSTGFVGSSLTSFLRKAGHEVIPLVRKKGQINAVFWDPQNGLLEGSHLEGFDAIVHLAGESVMGRWTAQKKQRILESRVRGTKLLCEALTRVSKKPQALVCASATGYYGDRGEEILVEESASGGNFLAEVCRGWEKATDSAGEVGIRTCNLRIGMVLSPGGGALKKMLPPFRMGVGGVIGSGRQFTSWISPNDLTRVILYVIKTAALVGPVNAVGPNPVTNLEMTKILGRILGRPTIFSLPAMAARLIFGQMAEELLLASARVNPARLIASGFKFEDSDLEGTLHRLLGK